MITRRDLLMTLGAGAVSMRMGSRRASAETPPLRGALLILHTPFTRDGAVDWEDLTREAEFVDRAGSHGIVWPQGSSSVTTLTKDERMRGMETLAKAVRGRRVALILGVQGADTAEMLEY